MSKDAFGNSPAMTHAEMLNEGLLTLCLQCRGIGVIPTGTGRFAQCSIRNCEDGFILTKKGRERYQG